LERLMARAAQSSLVVSQALLELPMAAIS